MKNRMYPPGPGTIGGEPSGTARAFRVRAEDKEAARRYFEQASATYETSVKRGPLRWLCDRERGAMLELAGLEGGGMSIIDVGCGGGFYSSYAKRAGNEVVSVDIAPGMIRRLEGKVDQCLVADIESLRFDRRFDRVICAGALDFVVDPRRALASLCRLVNDEGRLCILVPRNTPSAALYRVANWFRRIRVNLFTLEWFKAEAAVNGFGVCDVGYPLAYNMVLTCRRLSASPSDGRGRGHEPFRSVDIAAR